MLTHSLSSNEVIEITTGVAGPTVPFGFILSPTAMHLLVDTVQEALLINLMSTSKLKHLNIGTDSSVHFNNGARI